MHIDALNIDLKKVVNAEPVKSGDQLSTLMNIFIIVSLGFVCYGLAAVDPKLFWGAYYSNVIFWMGLSVGGAVTTAIFQIVGAVWSIPVRRIGEANVAFLPYALILLLSTYFGKEYLFPWGDAPMPGREWWMQPDFVYCRFGILLGILFFILWRFVNLSVKRDLLVMQEKGRSDSFWKKYPYSVMTQGYTKADVDGITQRLNYRAPIIIILYAIIYSLFSFEMVMGMDSTFYSNLFGAFQFVGNVYVGWATISLICLYIRSKDLDYSKAVGGQQMHDLGKLTLGFCILWAYMFFSQFLPIWYGNLPEETQWMILRTRENPWRILSWATFAMCFIIPFILLLSKDLKRTPKAFAITCLIIMFGVYFERFILVVPQLSPGSIPFGLMDVGIFIGFLGLYVLSIKSFLAKYPIIPVSHPHLNQH